MSEHIVEAGSDGESVVGGERVLHSGLLHTHQEKIHRTISRDFGLAAAWGFGIRFDWTSSSHWSSRALTLSVSI